MKNVSAQPGINPSGPHLGELIREFLDAQRDNTLFASLPTFCSRCGTRTIRVDMEFCFLGDDETWNIPLPLCPKCDMSGGTALMRRPTTTLQ